MVPQELSQFHDLENSTQIATQVSGSAQLDASLARVIGRRLVCQQVCVLHHVVVLSEVQQKVCVGRKLEIRVLCKQKAKFSKDL